MVLRHRPALLARVTDIIRGPGRARAAAVVAGYGFLLWTVVIVLFLPNGWLPVWTSAAATALLALDRRLGPLPAALLLLLAIPVGRGAEVGLPRLPGTDVPVRMHDAITLIGVGLALPALVRRLRRPRALAWGAAVPAAGFALAGLVALGVGVANDNAMRDIVRDARWWAFYAVAVVAVLAETSRPALMRALVLGLSIYAAIVLIGLLMPVFHGGLKWYAYSYDPRLRLHYGQAVFLLVAGALVTYRTVRAPSWSRLALLALLSAAIGVTLTRTLLAGMLGVTVVVAVLAARELGRPGGRLRSASLAAVARAALPSILAVVVGLAAGVATYSAGVNIWQPIGGSTMPTGRGSVPAEPPEHRPVLPSQNRILEDTASTGIAAQVGGRLTSYAYALTDMAESPLYGEGLGTLARVPWAWGGFRARTEGSQPGVDNAYLTVGLKAGAVGIAAFGAMVVWPLLLAWRRPRLRTWFIPAWLALLGLTLIQSFAVSGYAPFALSLLIALPALDGRRAARPRVRATMPPGTERSTARRSSPGEADRPVS